MFNHASSDSVYFDKFGRYPDDRRTYPWGSEDQNLVAFYQMLGKTRHAWSALSTGEYVNISYDNNVDY